MKTLPFVNRGKLTYSVISQFPVTGKTVSKINKQKHSNVNTHWGCTQKQSWRSPSVSEWICVCVSENESSFSSEQSVGVCRFGYMLGSSSMSPQTRVCVHVNYSFSSLQSANVCRGMYLQNSSSVSLPTRTCVCVSARLRLNSIQVTQVSQCIVNGGMQCTDVTTESLGHVVDAWWMAG